MNTTSSKVGVSFQKETIGFKETNAFSPLIIDYLDEKESLRHLYKYNQNIAAFKSVMEDKSKCHIDRETLVSVLEKQYDGIDTSQRVKENITSLRDGKTFTITTAHQPCIFTGPLYFIYKICSVIQLTSQLKKTYPEHRFVPVFWVGGEDHDFDEINHIYLFGKKLVWENEAQGAVGRMKLSEIESLVQTVEEMIGGAPFSEKLIAQIKESYRSEHTLARATILFIDSLFREYGLVVVDQDNIAFKEIFKSVITDELFNQFSANGMEPALTYLNEHYKVQARPREINFFYLKEGMRERIVRSDSDGFEVNNTDIRFTDAEIKLEIEKHPDRFSPNVILRPLYQQMILPNLAYIGGGGEIAYWLELKDVFDAQKRNFPMLLVRDSAMLLDIKLTAKLSKLNLTSKQLFEETELLITNYVKGILINEPELNEEKKLVQQMFEKVMITAANIDPTLEKSVGAEMQKVIKSLETLEQKFIRAEKRKHEVSTEQIRNMKSKLFPDNGLQERKENFITYYAKLGPAFIDALINNFDPLERKFKILTIE